MEEFKFVKKYADAYEKGTDIDGVYPNPMKMTPEDEISYYEKCESLANIVVKAVQGKDATKIRKAFLNFSCCRIEGIVSICALAICGVFGREIMLEYRDKKRNIHRKALEIGVYEMLRNLRMHSHTDMNGKRLFKSKYANRLINLLANDESICPDNNVVTLDKTNNANMRQIKLAMVFIMDYLDGNKCNIDKYAKVDYDLDKVIGMMEERIRSPFKEKDPTQLIRSVSFTQMLRF